jgi:sugar O-acyltransferase (sialic acid O-acetyltransferase NeuD family)
MSNKVVLFGEGKYAEMMYHYFTKDSADEVVAFTADGEFIKKKDIYGLPVVPFEDIASKFPPGDFKMFVAVGYQDLNRLRASKCAEAKAKGYGLANFVSSKASNYGGAEIGENSLVMENSTIQPCASIGNNVTIWSNNLIGHHSTIEDHCYIAGQAVVSGNTKVGPYCFVGVGATIGHEIRIGEECIIGAGSYISRNAEPKSVFIAENTEAYRLDSDAFLKMTSF